MNREELAWAAGFFDGEGCTHVHNIRRKTGKHYKYAAISVGQTDESRESLLRLQALFGGTIYRHKDVNHQLRIHGYEKVQAAVAMMWPWLGTIKREQAARVLEEVRTHGLPLRPE